MVVPPSTQSTDEMRVMIDLSTATQRAPRRIPQAEPHADLIGPPYSSVRLLEAGG